VVVVVTVVLGGGAAVVLVVGAAVVVVVVVDGGAASVVGGGPGAAGLVVVVVVVVGAGAGAVVVVGSGGNVDAASAVETSAGVLTVPCSMAANAAAAIRPSARVGRSAEIIVVGTGGAFVENAAKPINPPSEMITRAPNAIGGRSRTVELRLPLLPKDQPSANGDQETTGRLEKGAQSGQPESSRFRVLTD
jgi:hypothetical protein